MKVKMQCFHMTSQNSNNWIIGTAVYVATDYSHKWESMISFYMN